MSKTPPIPKKPNSRMAYADRLGVSSMPVAAPDNMRDQNTVNMGFKVDDEFKRAFKTTAAGHGISMTDLLKQSFELWVEAKQKG